MDTPKYLLTKRFLAQTVVFIVLFSIIFMVVFRPSFTTGWAYSLCFTAVLVVSKLLMYLCHRRGNFTVLRYALWVVAEMVVLSVLYIVFAMYAAPDPQEFSLKLALDAFTYLPVMLLIPYAIVILWASNMARREEFEMLRLSYKAAMRGLDPQLLHLYDAKGELKMSVRSSAIYYVEAQDNYVQIFYDMDDRMCSYLLRCSTQKLEKAFEGTSLVRCHRSYIVNTDHVKLFRNEKDGPVLLLDSPDSRQLPVSRTYYKQTLSKMEERGPLALS